MQNAKSKISLNKTGLDSFTHSKLFCYLAPFAVLMAYLVYILATVKNDSFDNYYILHYLWNYDKGFISRGLVGEIISWFTDTVTLEMIRIFAAAGSVILVLAATLCIGAVLDKTRDNPQVYRTALFIIVLLSAAPFTFKAYLPDIKYDKIFWAVTLLAVFLSQKKLGIWFVPALCAVAMLINPLFLFGGMLLVGIILLHECCESGFSTKNIIICAVTYIGIIALAIYDVAGAYPDFANEQEMAAYFFARYSEPVSAETINRVADVFLNDFFEKKNMDYIAEQAGIFLVGWNRGEKTIFNAVFVSIPVMTLLTVFWVKVIKAEKEKFRKFIFFLCCATMAAEIVFTVLVAWDFSRYIAYSFIVQLGLVIYFLVKKNEAVISVTGEVREFCKNHVLVAASTVSYLALFINKIY